MSGSSDVLAEVAAALDAYVATWNSGAQARLVEHWDEHLAEPIYIAEEAPPIVGWDALRAYWAAMNGHDVSMSIGTPHWQMLADGLALAHYPMRWRSTLHGHAYWTKAIGGHVRVTAIFARRGADWKLVHYVEAPLAAAVQVKHWLERDAEG